MSNNKQESSNKIKNNTKSLHELLKQGGGQNLIIDFSLLSKRSTLTSLINKGKNNNLNLFKNQEEPNTNKSKGIIYEHKKLSNSKNFALLNRMTKKLKKNSEDNISDPNFKEEISEPKLEEKFNKMNIGTSEFENTDETENTYPGCLEIKYENNISENDSIKNSDNNKNKNIQNYNNKTMGKNININTKINNYKQIYNINNNVENQYYKPFTQRYQEKPSIINQNNNYYIEENQIEEPNNFTQNSFYEEQNKSYYKPEKKSKNFFKTKNKAIEYETVKENYSIKYCNTVLEYSFREDQNIDSETTMEDKSKSIENFNNEKNQMVFEIFDGHGGDEISTYLQSNLAQIYKQNLLLNKGNIILSLKNAFHDADIEMRNIFNIEGLGSTGTLVHVIWEANNDLVIYSANVGDSRVSLISPEHIIRLSYDHRTTDEKEKKRILDSGMEINDNRINGTLMLTRIFGNYEYKNYLDDEDNDYNNNQGLICEPFISKINIDLNIPHQFLILASDGIWDIMSEEEIQNIIKTQNDTQQICSIIIKNCLRKEAWDNMSIFAIKLT